MKENRLIVQWVQHCLQQRISSYRWALERLVIQAPDDMAADADRLIGATRARTANPPVVSAPVSGLECARIARSVTEQSRVHGVSKMALNSGQPTHRRRRLG